MIGRALTRACIIEVCRDVASGDSGFCGLVEVSRVRSPVRGDGFSRLHGGKEGLKSPLPVVPRIAFDWARPLDWGSTSSSRTQARCCKVTAQ